MKNIIQETPLTKHDPPLFQGGEGTIAPPRHPSKRSKNACGGILLHSTINLRHGFSPWVGGVILLRTNRTEGIVPAARSTLGPIVKQGTEFLYSSRANDSRGGVE